MELLLQREPSDNKSTIGSLSINNAFFCYTLEDVIRDPGVKVYGETAIPAGRYRVVITFSPHFGHKLPLLIDVPGFTGVRIHPGNKPADTLGCVLVGFARAQDWISESQKAFDALFPQIEKAISAGEEVWITVKSPESTVCPI